MHLNSCTAAGVKIDTGSLYLSLISHTQAYQAERDLIPAKP